MAIKGALFRLLRDALGKVVRSPGSRAALGRRNPAVPEVYGARPGSGDAGALPATPATHRSTAAPGEV